MLASPAGTVRGTRPTGQSDDIDLAALRVATYLDDGISPPTGEVAAVVSAAANALGEVTAVVAHATPGCLGSTMELLWKSVFLGDDRNRGFEEDLQEMGVSDPSEELAEFLTQARKVECSLTDARRHLTELDAYRVEMLDFMADYDVILCPDMPGPGQAAPSRPGRNQ